MKTITRSEELRRFMQDKPEGRTKSEMAAGIGTTINCIVTLLFHDRHSAHASFASYWTGADTMYILITPIVEVALAAKTVELRTERANSAKLASEVRKLKDLLITSEEIHTSERLQFVEEIKQLKHEKEELEFVIVRYTDAAGGA